jgi:uncharacterized protein (DUF58 family)
MATGSPARPSVFGFKTKREMTLREQAEHLGARLPPLMVEAERVAATVAQGAHGRRRVGIGETFWQFRRFRDEDSSAVIDWRQSGKTQHLFVREREWEAAASVWLWRDTSKSMQYKSSFAPCSKVQRATVLALAFASLLVRGGERISELGAPEPPTTGRLALNRLAHRMTTAMTAGPNTPPLSILPRFSQVILISDWLSPIEETSHILRHFGGLGVRGHLIQVLDPSEEDFTFDGRTEFEDVESSLRMVARRAETMREGYRNRLANLRDSLAQAARRQNWTFASHRTDRAPQGALLAAYAAITAHKPFAMT